MGDRVVLGGRGEDVAVAHLELVGMQVVARNWRCRHGELDVVAREGDTLVFCEVKTRRGLGFGTPLAAITPAKCARLRRLASAYLTAEGRHRGPIRFDGVGILMRADGRVEVEHVRGIA
ncbi:MAG: YraN family protein [Candidatus Nanopelagicales bacterium]|jgi:putative endonuclease|nr:YraN family protein [Candidatus Nanopelagicales bacterium]